MPEFERLPEADDRHAVFAEQAVGVLAEPVVEQVDRARSFALHRVGAELEAARIGRDVLAGDAGTARRRSEPRRTALRAPPEPRRLRGGGGGRRDDERRRS